METSSGLKKKLLQNFVVTISQSLELEGTNTIGGGWLRAGDLPGPKLWMRNFCPETSHSVKASG